jgi:ABC-type transport system substrate-binding protein
VAVLLAAGCGGGDDDQTAEGGGEGASTTTQALPTGDAVGQGSVVMALTAAPDGFLPAKNRWAPSTLQVARAVMDPLAAFDADGVAHPYLAESIEPNEDFTEWTIVVRQDIKFHNGEDLTAEAVALNLTEVATSALTGSAYRPFGSAEAVDASTVKVTMTSPWAHFPLVLANQTGYMVAPQMIREGRNDVQWGTGPFFPTDYKPGDSFTAGRNVNYWQADANGTRLPYLAEVEFRFVPDPNTRENGLDAGDYDIIHTDSAESVLRYAELGESDPQGDIRVLLDASEGTENHVLFNTADGAFADVRLRQAAAYAIDRQALVDDLYGGFFEVANGPFTAGSAWGEPDGFPGYDPARAEELVAEWSADNGGAAPEVALTVIASSDYLTLAQYIEQQWAAVGFDTTIESIEEAAGTGKLVSGQFESLVFNFWDRPDPDALYHYWYGPNAEAALPINFARWQNAEADAALDAGRVTDDLDVRKAEYQKVWSAMAEDVPYLWLYHTKWVIAYGDGVYGVGNHVLPDGAPAEPVTWGQIWLTSVWKP